MTNRQPQTITTLVGVDAAFFAINEKLKIAIPWLTSAYGKAERLAKVKENRRHYYPAIYSGQNEYLELFPDEHLGSYSFWYTENKTPITNISPVSTQQKVKCSLVVWFDYRTARPDTYETETLENIKKEFSDELRKMAIANTSIEVQSFYETMDEIYKPYTVKLIGGRDTTETKNFPLMRPFGGFRIECSLIVREICI